MSEYSLREDGKYDYKPTKKVMFGKDVEKIFQSEHECQKLKDNEIDEMGEHYE